MQAEGEIVQLPGHRVMAPKDFRTFFEDEHARLFKTLYFVTGDRSEAADLMQEAFLKLWERWDRIDRGIVTAVGPFTRSMPADEGRTRGGVWIVNTATGSETRIQHLPHGAFWFDVSQDGSTIAFSARSHGRTQIYVAAPDGSGARVVTHDPYEASQPALSPDASMLAYQGFGREDRRNVFVEDLATGRVRQLTHERHDVSDLSWSADGTRILYSMSILGNLSAKVFDPGASSVLKVVDVATGNGRRVSGNHDTAADFGAWSPDGGHIAYMTGHEWTDNAYGFNPAEIWVMDANGSKTRRLATLDARAFGLMWTPDGNLSYSQEDGDAFNTYQLNVETGADQADHRRLDAGLARRPHRDRRALSRSRGSRSSAEHAGRASMP